MSPSTRKTLIRQLPEGVSQSTVLYFAAQALRLMEDEADTARFCEDARDRGYRSDWIQDLELMAREAK